MLLVWQYICFIHYLLIRFTCAWILLYYNRFKIMESESKLENGFMDIMTTLPVWKIPSNELCCCHLGLEVLIWGDELRGKADGVKALQGICAKTQCTTRRPVILGHHSHTHTNTCSQSISSPAGFHCSLSWDAGQWFSFPLFFFPDLFLMSQTRSKLVGVSETGTFCHTQEFPSRCREETVQQ